MHGALYGLYGLCFAVFSAAPWQGLEKTERGPNSFSLFLPQAAVVAVAVQVLPGPKEKDTRMGVFLWASQDLNPGPSGYEPPALTN